MLGQVGTLVCYTMSNQGMCWVFLSIRWCVCTERASTNTGLFPYANVHIGLCFSRG